ncbi:MAG: family 20 glycosylhydrolase [Candidatus Cryptobacteroides sp.]
MSVSSFNITSGSGAHLFRDGFCLLVGLCLLSCSRPAEIRVIPAPQQVSIQRGCFDFAGAVFEYDSAMDQASLDYVRAFEHALRSAMGTEADCREGEHTSSARKNAPKVNFRYDISLTSEEYTINSSSMLLEISASSLNGFVYAIQTIKQMLPLGIWSSATSECDSAKACIGDNINDTRWTIPAMTIRDYPRFAYRGLHLDCARHIFSLDEVRRFIDLMEIHKLNRLHWHLTDDQGWRIEIKSHPKITSVGAWREGTMVGHDFSSNDGIRYGGYYTQEELRSIVSYAASKGITIIPEIDLPGHTQSIIAAYPELGCTGGPYEVRTTWGVSEEVICAGNEDVYKVLEDILTEVMDIFPSEYIHIGGDECPKNSWEACPKCQAKISELGLADDEHFKAEDYLQSYVMNRVEDFLNDHGRRVIGWDEVLDGNISQSATIMSWRGAAGGIKAAQSGRYAIMTPNSYLYFDYCQSRDRDGEPLSIGGYLPVNRVYSYEPYDEQMTPQECEYILGVQANLWTEYIADYSVVEYMILPRLDALSEVQWCEPQNKDFERFRRNLLNMKDIYDALGARYATHIFDGRMDEEQKAIPSVSHKALGKKAKLLSTPHLNYRFSAPEELFDGKRGDRTFTSGAWIGFEGEPLDVVIPMSRLGGLAGSTSVESVSIECLSDKGNYIFAPIWLKVSSSEDGENFTQIGFEEFQPEGADDADGVKTFTVSFPQSVKAKWLRVEAATIDTLPQWHPGAGAKAFLFIDEVIVK